VVPAGLLRVENRFRRLKGHRGMLSNETVRQANTEFV
jgi:hypothetical protein